MAAGICVAVVLCVLIIALAASSISEDIRDTKVKIRALELGIKNV